MVLPVAGSSACKRWTSGSLPGHLFTGCWPQDEPPVRPQDGLRAAAGVGSHVPISGLQSEYTIQVRNVPNLDCDLSGFRPSGKTDLCMSRVTSSLFVHWAFGIGHWDTL